MSQYHPGGESVLIDINNRLHKQEKETEAVWGTLVLAGIGIALLFFFGVKPYVKDVKKERDGLRQEVRLMKSEIERMKIGAVTNYRTKDVLGRLRQSVGKK